MMNLVYGSECPGYSVEECLWNLLETSKREKRTFLLHFSNVKKAGVNPHAPWDTPSGIYGYILNKCTIEELLSNEPKRCLSHFATDRKYIHIIELDRNKAGDIITLSKDGKSGQYNNLSYESDKLILGHYYEHIDIFSEESDLSDIFTTPFSKIWYLTQLLAEGSAARWNKILREYLHILAVIDKGSGTIHPNEPMSAIILRGDAVKSVILFDNPIYSKLSDNKIRRLKNTSLNLSETLKIISQIEDSSTERKYEIARQLGFGVVKITRFIWSAPGQIDMEQRIKAISILISLMDISLYWDIVGYDTSPIVGYKELLIFLRKNIAYGLAGAVLSGEFKKNKSEHARYILSRALENSEFILYLIDLIKIYKNILAFETIRLNKIFDSNLSNPEADNLLSLWSVISKYNIKFIPSEMKNLALEEYLFSDAPLKVSNADLFYQTMPSFKEVASNEEYYGRFIYVLYYLGVNEALSMAKKHFNKSKATEVDKLLVIKGYEDDVLNKYEKILSMSKNNYRIEEVLVNLIIFAESYENRRSFDLLEYYLHDPIIYQILQGFAGNKIVDVILKRRGSYA